MSELYTETSEYVWSKFDNKPILKYLPELDSYIVFWNGIVLSHKLALCIAAAQLLHQYPTPSMRRKAAEDHKKLYLANAFGNAGHDSWKWIIESGHDTIYRKAAEYMSEHTRILDNKNISPKEIFSWFLYEKAAKIS